LRNEPEGNFAVEVGPKFLTNVAACEVQSCRWRALIDGGDGWLAKRVALRFLAAQVIIDFVAQFPWETKKRRRRSI
jgi:hypothetical protein